MDGSVDQFLLPCAYKQLFDISCPFCGFQRSILLLQEGMLWDSIIMFPPFFPLIIAVLFSLYAFCSKKFFIIKVTKYLWILVLVLLCCNMIMKNIGV